MDLIRSNFLITFRFSVTLLVFYLFDMSLFKGAHEKFSMIEVWQDGSVGKGLVAKGGKRGLTPASCRLTATFVL